MRPPNDAVAALRALLPASAVIDDPGAVDAVLVDERGQYRGRAALVVCPASTAELSAVLAHCHTHGIGVVPQGGNTGYCGGATPDGSGTQVLVSLRRMNRIRALDAIGFTTTVEAGVVLADLQAAAAARDLLFPLSMGSEGSAQVGGALSTNAGGLTVLRYGTARDLTLGLEVVLPDGSVLDQLAPLRKDSTGYDLRALFIGAEGTLGVISAASLKLFPPPRARHTAFVALPDLAAVCRLLGRLRRGSADAVTSFEYVSRRSLALTLAHDADARAPFPAHTGDLALVEVTGAGDESDLGRVFEAILAEALEAGDVEDVVIARSGAERRALWRLRERIPLAEKVEGGSIKHDVSIAVSDIPQFCREAEQAVAALLPDARLSVYGHVGDGNVHFNVLAPIGYAGADFRAVWTDTVSTAVHDVVARLRGSFSAEHGVGQLKRADLLRYESPVAVRLMRTLKAAIDPKGIMNPGKVL